MDELGWMSWDGWHERGGTVDGINQTTPGILMGINQEVCEEKHVGPF